MPWQQCIRLIMAVISRHHFKRLFKVIMCACMRVHCCGSPRAARRASPESTIFPLPFSMLKLSQPCTCHTYPHISPTSLASRVHTSVPNSEWSPRRGLPGAYGPAAGRVYTLYTSAWKAVAEIGGKVENTVGVKKSVKAIRCCKHRPFQHIQVDSYW